MISSSRKFSFKDPCRQIVVGIPDTFLKSCTKLNTTEMTLANCQSFMRRSGYYWLRMIASFLRRPSTCNSTLFEYELVKVKNDSTVLDSLVGRVDLIPQLAPLEESAPRKFALTSQVLLDDFFFHVKLDQGALTSNSYSEAAFLSAPFQTTTWYCVLVSLAMILALHFLVDRLQQKQTRRLKVNYFIDLCLSTLAMAFICAAYASSLKWLMIGYTVPDPFHSIFELADRLRRNELQLIVENKNRVPFFLVTKKQYRTSEELTALQLTIENNPNALQLVAKSEKACQLLLSSSKFVYIGYKQQLNRVSGCENVCFWTFPIDLQPKEYFLLFLRKHVDTVLFQAANLAACAVPNYIENEDRQYRTAACVSATKQQMIKLSTLMYAFVFLIGMWTIACVTFAFEVTFVRFVAKFS